MRRIILAIVGAAALAAGAVALAAGGSTTSVTGTFTATTVSNLKTTTCTGTDGTYQLTDAWYSGTATSSDSHLNGPITIHARTNYNTGENLGTVRADLRIGAPGPGGTHARLIAVDSAGTLGGSVAGHAGPGTSLVGTFSGTFVPATGFSAASIGTGGSGALLINPCRPLGPHAPKTHGGPHSPTPPGHNPPHKPR